jgi:hypothetical protein
MNAIERRKWDEQMWDIETHLSEIMDDLEMLAGTLDDCDVEQMARLLKLASAFKQIGVTITESMVEGVSK